MTEEKKKMAVWICMVILLLWYVAGVLTNFAGSGILSFHPFVCLAAGLSRAGVRCILLLVLLLGALAMGISLKGREGIAGEDRERNFSYSRQGTYGTAGFMQGKERKEVLAADPDVRQVRGTILGTDPESGAQPAGGQPVKQKLCDLRQPGLHEIPRHCPQYDYPVRETGRKHGPDRFQIGAI